MYSLALLALGSACFLKGATTHGLSEYDIRSPAVDADDEYEPGLLYARDDHEDTDNLASLMDIRDLVEDDYLTFTHQRRWNFPGSNSWKLNKAMKALTDAMANINTQCNAIEAKLRAGKPVGKTNRKWLSEMVAGLQKDRSVENLRAEAADGDLQRVTQLTKDWKIMIGRLVVILETLEREDGKNEELNGNNNGRKKKKKKKKKNNKKTKRGISRVGEDFRKRAGGIEMDDKDDSLGHLAKSLQDLQHLVQEIDQAAAGHPSMGQARHVNQQKMSRNDMA